jgi:hypothetical protein
LDGKPLAIPAAHWDLYHAAAVLASNYQVTLMDAALELMEGAGLGRGEALDALGPLLRASTENVLSAGPEHALTGPVRRGDVGTVRKHLAGLAHCLPETKQLYQAAGLRTVPLAVRAGLSEETASAIIDALTLKSDRPPVAQTLSLPRPDSSGRTAQRSTGSDISRSTTPARSRPSNQKIARRENRDAHRL